MKKISSSLLIMILASMVIIVVYFVTKHSRFSTNDSLSQNSYNCSVKAKDFDTDIKNDLGKELYSVYITNHYNEQASKCFVYVEVYIRAVGFSKNADEFWYSKMYDGYEKKVIFSCGAGTFAEQEGGCDLGGSVYDIDFQDRYKKYFIE